ncbi:MAG: hypothetical protein LBC87_12060 [Fibromonadaceae bacterium]|jgi:hypothetical protein|nr:hypothetical protein [Fibromonadaceae bacterium]
MSQPSNIDSAIDPSCVLADQPNRTIVPNFIVIVDRDGSGTNNVVRGTTIGKLVHPVKNGTYKKLTVKAKGYEDKVIENVVVTDNNIHIDAEMTPLLHSVIFRLANPEYDKSDPNSTPFLQDFQVRVYDKPNPNEYHLYNSGTHFDIHGLVPTELYTRSYIVCPVLPGYVGEALEIYIDEDRGVNATAGGLVFDPTTAIVLKCAVGTSEQETGIKCGSCKLSVILNLLGLTENDLEKLKEILKCCCCCKEKPEKFCIEDCSIEILKQLNVEDCGIEICKLLNIEDCDINNL